MKRVRVTITNDMNGILIIPRTTVLMIEEGPDGEPDIRLASESRMDADRSVPVDVFVPDDPAITVVISVESADG